MNLYHRSETIISVVISARNKKCISLVFGMWQGVSVVHLPNEWFIE